MNTYICDPEACSEIHGEFRGVLHGSGQCWHETTRRRLAWQQGMSEPTVDVADIAAWNGLGSRKRAAA